MNGIKKVESYIHEALLQFDEEEDTNVIIFKRKKTSMQCVMEHPP